MQYFNMRNILVIILLFLAQTNCFTKNIESDSTIVFFPQRCQVELNYFRQETIHISGIKGYYFFVKVNSNFNPTEKISDWFKLLDRNGKPIIPKSKYVEFDKINYKDLYSSTYGIIYYVLDGSESGIYEIKILDKEEERNENLNSYNFKPNDSKEFKILNFKKNVIAADYLFTNIVQDTSLFNNISKTPLINELNGFYLYDELRLKHDLFTKKVEIDNYFSLLPYYETMYKNGKKDIKFLNEYCTALESVASTLFDEQQIESSKLFSDKLYIISLNDSSLSKFEVASRYFEYAYKYKTINNDDADSLFQIEIESIKKYEDKFEKNENYKYKFFLLLGNMNYVTSNEGEARRYYNKIINSDAPPLLKEKAKKNYELVKPEN